jgi:hypothetical protein
MRACHYVVTIVLVSCYIVVVGANFRYRFIRWPQFSGVEI